MLDNVIIRRCTLEYGGREYLGNYNLLSLKQKLNVCLEKKKSNCNNMLQSVKLGKKYMGTYPTVLQLFYRSEKFSNGGGQKQLTIM